MAGSPTKHTRTEADEELDGPQTDEPQAREEMNGIIIYDSYAKLTGCEKIVKYFEERKYSKVDHNILFSKDEVK